MTENLIKELKTDLIEELEGVKKYIKRSQEAEKDGEKGDSMIFIDMAREEFCHAKHIKAMIHENTGSLSVPSDHDEMIKKFSEVEKMVNSF